MTQTKFKYLVLLFGEENIFAKFKILDILLKNDFLMMEKVSNKLSNFLLIIFGDYCIRRSSRNVKNIFKKIKIRIQKIKVRKNRKLCVKGAFFWRQLKYFEL